MLRHRIENIAVHRDGICNSRTGLLTELLGQTFKNRYIVIYLILPRKSHPTSVQPQDIIALEA